ncbi:hypothetical protein CL629_01465 [bacterium]|nr:hypothetical protein [bacterium]
MIVRPEDRALGKKLRRRRESTRPRLSLANIAILVDPKPLTRQTLSYIEKGKVRASKPVLRAYENALGLEQGTLTSLAIPPRPRGRKPLRKGSRRK